MHPMNTAEQIGANLVARRKALDLSQTDVASQIGLSQNRLSELESHPGTLTVDQLLALAKVLGLQIGLDAASGTGAATTQRKVEW